MDRAKIASYGSWKSPISSELIVAGTVGLTEVVWDGEDICWLERRPSERGRNAIARRSPSGKIADVIPTDFSARNRVHEYGGGSFLMADGTVYFSNAADRRIYRQTPEGRPEPLTPEGNISYADYILDRQRERLICVREDPSGGGEPVNTLVAINIESDRPNQSGENIEVLVAGSDFYSSPRLSPDGFKLCWLSWNHPNMPWDGTELWVASIREDGSLAEAERVAGGLEESIFQPEWSPDGVLYFVSDRSGWWNLYKWQPTSQPKSQPNQEKIVPLCQMPAEFGLPQWVFRMSTYSFASAGEIICTYTQQGIWHLARIETSSGKIEQIATPYTSITSPAVAGNRVVFLGGSPTESTSIVLLDLETRNIEVLRRSSQLEIDAGYLSAPQAIEFPTENGLTAYGIFYPPTNRDYAAPSDELPPLLVKSHSGPTSAARSGLSLKIQYWTSRGFAFLDVNYGGSTGYGREYRRRLEGQWGAIDVDDCANGAQYLVERGLVDGNKLAIAGSSAGGYTTLCALTFRDTFKAGASYYGISDLEAFVNDTHKFELRYTDRLVGPYPERKDLYEERSPIRHCDRLSCPVIFFQGLEDNVVLPSQAEMMVAALKAKNLPVAYIPFEGEQHGFRQAENIKRALDAELYFYSRVFGFEPAEDLEPVVIANL
ncbi:MAG: S9 family peptidase [Oscillatoria sp. SIO1A7]|nr:S9 family peptidase [Oscillatoria sp. SIO1A7]